MKSRFCPSPTGHIHIGNARTALFNYLAAKGQQGVFLLRIEDTDKVRSENRFADGLMADLEWMGIHWQEGPRVEGPHAPYWQSQRQEIYNVYYEKLIQRALAYPCFCSDDLLALQRKVQLASGQPPRYAGTCRHLTPAQIQEKLTAGEMPSLRFQVPEAQEIVFDDAVKGRQVFLSQDIGDFIIRRADGSASFIFCNAIDDALMGVTLALRGDDHLSNTPRQLLIMQALELAPPRYGHICMILGDDGAPLSKRNGSVSIADLRSRGFLPESVVNYLARLGHYYEQSGWLTVSECASFFQLNTLGVSPARFDQVQLLHWQREGVLRLDESAFWRWCGGVVTTLVPEAARTDFYTALRGNVLFPDEVQSWAEVLYQTLECTPEAAAIIRSAGAVYFQQAITLWSADDFKSFVRALGKALDLKGKALFEPLRIALTGRHDGPELSELQKLLGNECILHRLQQAQASCL